MLTPFYDPEKTYEENYDKGPFGAFSDGELVQSVQSRTLHKQNVAETIIASRK